VLLLLIVVFLYAFTAERNNNRIVSDAEVNFLGENHLFITHETVSKLLIQKQEGVTSVRKEVLDLNELEQSLTKNPMIEFAEVYVNVEGKLSAKIKQKKPIARVFTGSEYYIDSKGSYMPLSKNYSERVPFVTGKVNKKDLSVVYKIASKIQEDQFLKTHVVEIHQNADKSIDLKLRQCKFVVKLGELKQLDKKINNLKAFYSKAIKDKSLEKYSVVNLQFDNQVVCTKV